MLRPLEGTILSDEYGCFVDIYVSFNGPRDRKDPIPGKPLHRDKLVHIDAINRDTGEIIHTCSLRSQYQINNTCNVIMRLGWECRTRLDKPEKAEG